MPAFDPPKANERLGAAAATAALYHVAAYQFRERAIVLLDLFLRNAKVATTIDALQ
jgi:hypothetical protein